MPSFPPSLKKGAPLLLALLAVLAGLYALMPYHFGYEADRLSILHRLWVTWELVPDWRHGALVPFITLFILWDKRSQFHSLPVQPSNLGWVLVLFALAFYYVGYVIDQHYLGYLSLQILLAGWILMFLGREWLGHLAFPLAFLLFMWPFMFLDNMIAFPLRSLMSKMAYGILYAIGVDVVRSGTAIISAPIPQLGVRAGEQFAVDIADPCSGIRSLFALMMVSALYAYFMVRTETGFRIQNSVFGKKLARLPLLLSILQACVENWRRWLLFACSVPLAVLGNLVRILTLTFGTILFGAEFAIGKNALTEPSVFHMAAGYLVFAVALGGMVGVGWLLNQENSQWKLWASQLRAWFAALKKTETPGQDGKAKPKNSRPASEY